MTSNTQEALIRTQVHGQVGTIELWRPKALHSLNMPMVTAITAALQQWEHDPEIQEIIIVARGGKGFCAGGDVRYAREAMQAGDPAVEDFFQAEYRMDAYIAGYPKPIAALVDGIVMGGGMGLAAHCTYRVISPQTLGAMPETAIGFAPDVGMTAWLRDACHDVGLSTFLLGLGWHMQAADLQWIGFATHVATDMEQLEADIYTQGLQAALTALEATPQPELAESQLAVHAAEISRICTQSWPEIQADLARTKLAADAEKFLRQANPESLVATSLLVEHVAHQEGIASALYAEYAVGHYMRHRPNFSEGVRAVLVDKDKNPQFTPATLKEIEPEFAATVSTLLADANQQRWLATAGE